MIIAIGVVLTAAMLASGMSIMHNVLQGGQREDGSHVETPQEAVDNGTPWALLAVVLSLVGAGLVALAGGAL